MKKLVIFFFLLPFLPVYAQQGITLVFEEKAAFDTVKLQGVKLLYNHVKLYSSQDNPRLDIFNFYFSTNNFKASELNRKGFSEALTNYHKLTNDVLITITPLTDSFNAKLIKVSTTDLSKMVIMKPEELMQEAIRNLHHCFSENDMQHDDKPGVTKTFRYKLLIKRGNSYYAIKAPILTEYYLIDKACYLYPIQYHYGEINTQKPGWTNYVSGQDILDVLRQHTSSVNNNYYPIRAVSRRTYPRNLERKDSCNLYTYWTYPGFPDDMVGIGKLQFIEGVGIVNGTYGTYFNKNFMIDLENNQYGYFEDFNGPFVLKIKSINGLPLEELCKRIYETGNQPGKIKSAPGY
ncbi:MAG: hypothetical protein JST50_03350 [Bacteroidetes bacterium]|jgi:hypothetical protein|nr:hypothetical protein [Bacteroidota bacterium]